MNWKKKIVSAALAVGLGLSGFAAQAFTLKVSSPTNNDSILKWMETFKEDGVDPFFYTTRKRSEDEIFPWDILDCGVDKKFLYREWQNALSEKVSPNCRKQCLGCGARKYDTGVCMEERE